jgi:hypothetical protein
VVRRADYRAMTAAQQMLAASIIWLYRGGKDNRWLRRGAAHMARRRCNRRGVGDDDGFALQEHGASFDVQTVAGRRRATPSNTLPQKCCG